MPKILIADDDESILEAIRLVLEKASYNVVIAGSSMSMQRKIQEENPDLIIIDILMSGTDGREIVYYLRQEGLKKKIPIIMISALPNAEKTAKKAGADAFLAKPFDIKQLLLYISKLLEKYK